MKAVALAFFHWVSLHARLSGHYKELENLYGKAVSKKTKDKQCLSTLDY